MKDILLKYYGFVVKDCKKYSEGIIFFINGDNYYLCRCYLDDAKIKSIYKLVNDIKNKYCIMFHDFVFNNDGNILSDGYVLFKLNVFDGDIDQYDLFKYNSIIVEEYEKNNFYDMWINIIDYLEIQISEISDNKMINNSFDYFVGIAEMLLSFYKINKGDLVSNYLSHNNFNSLSSIEFYNPLNVCVNNKYKDIVSYIRLTNNWEMLHKLIAALNDFEKKYVYVRLAFPFSYFRCINELIVDGVGVEKLMELVNDINVYEDYLVGLDNIFGYKLFYWIKKDN